MGLLVGLMICYSKRSQTKQDVRQLNKLTNTQCQRFASNTALHIHSTSIILVEAISSVTKTESSSRKMNKFICTKKNKLLSSWNISLLQILMLVNNLMLSISTTCMKRVQQSLKIAWKDLWKNSHRIISVWWQSQEPKVQTLITLKFQSCWVSKSFKGEESPWWSRERLYLHLSLMTPTQELQDSSVTDSWPVFVTKSSSSTAWLADKVSLIQQSRLHVQDIFKDVWWNIWKV